MAVAFAECSSSLGWSRLANRETIASMIRPDKLSSALYTLQGVLIRARTLAYGSGTPQQLASLLDDAEYLPRLIARESDETDRFRRVLDGGSCTA
jgi:hypothetical protein